MKKFIFLILKKCKLDRIKLVKFYLKFGLKLEINNYSSLNTYFSNVEDLEEAVDGILKYIDFKQSGLLFNISNLNNKKIILIKNFYISKDMKYILNVTEINERILKKIIDIKQKIIELEKSEPYHSRSLKTHIMYIDDYLSVIDF